MNRPHVLCMACRKPIVLPRRLSYNVFQFQRRCDRCLCDESTPDEIAFRQTGIRAARACVQPTVHPTDDVPSPARSRRATTE